MFGFNTFFFSVIIIKKISFKSSHSLSTVDSSSEVCGYTVLRLPNFSFAKTVTRHNWTQRRRAIHRVRPWNNERRGLEPLYQTRSYESYTTARLNFNYLTAPKRTSTPTNTQRLRARYFVMHFSLFLSLFAKKSEIY